MNPVEQSVNASVMKSGEICIRTIIGRSRDHNSGLTLNVWAHPRVEDFIRSLGTGEHIDVHTIGRHWSPPDREKDRKMFVYQLSQDLGELTCDDKFFYRLDRPGSPLVDSGADDGELAVADEDRGRPRSAFKSLTGRANESLNLSFLRLVGISDQNGVSFNVSGVYQRESIIRLGERIEQASNRFYREFLKPYRLMVTVSTMPIPDGY